MNVLALQKAAAQPPDINQLAAKTMRTLHEQLKKLSRQQKNNVVMLYKNCLLTFQILHFKNNEVNHLIGKSICIAKRTRNEK
jgi:hypothetical protein